jgi:hypothetical protein
MVDSTGVFLSKVLDTDEKPSFNFSKPGTVPTSVQCTRRWPA